MFMPTLTLMAVGKARVFARPWKKPRFARVAAFEITKIKHKTKHSLPDEPQAKIYAILDGYRDSRRKTPSHLGISVGFGTLTLSSLSALYIFTDSLMVSNSIIQFAFAFGMISLVYASKWGSLFASKWAARKVNLFDELIAWRDAGRTQQELLQFSCGSSPRPQKEIDLLTHFANQVGIRKS